MRAESNILMGMASVSTSSGGDFFAFPLTPAQRGMWPKGLGTFGEPRYNGAFRLKLQGSVDVELLRRAFHEIALRHESLRTMFRTLPLSPDDTTVDIQQVVYPIPDIAVEVIDLRSFPEMDRETMVDGISTQEAQQAFDLSRGCPIRVKLLRIADRESVLTLTIHQIVCDGWSIGILMEELAAIYAALALKRDSPLSPLEFQFGDFVAWQGEQASSAEVARQRTYWQQKLEGCPQVQVLTDMPAATASTEAGIISEVLPRDLTDRLREAGQARDATFFVVTMAACMVLISRYTGEPDLALRTPLAGRTRLEFEPIIGQLVNQVAIRARLHDGITFGEFIDRVRESLWEALANQEAPFEDVLRSIAVPKNAGIEQPFNINFVCQREYGRNGPSQFEFDGVIMTTLPSKSQGAYTI